MFATTRSAVFAGITVSSYLRVGLMPEKKFECFKQVLKFAQWSMLIGKHRWKYILL